MDFKKLLDNWPCPYVVRDQRILDQFSGGLLNAKSLANADSQGTGPQGKFRVGRRVAYPVESVVAWLQAKFENGNGGS